MKVPIFAGRTLSEFLKSAKVAGKQKLSGLEVSVYGTDVSAPNFCARENCQTEQRLRRNGSYTRQVIEGLKLVLVLIYRFRCGLCGGTSSRPYSFLVPYRRFTTKLICRSIEVYGAEEQTSYREVSGDLSVFAPETENGAGSKLAEETPSGKEGFCPARSTVFSWVDFLCKRIALIVQQVEKELVLRNFDMNELPIESQFRNKNAWKSGKERDKHQQNKPEQLNKLSYGLGLARALIDGGQGAMENLRAYFLESAEKCADLLSDVLMELPITQTSEHLNW